jgi:S1-C subfamily serine protease
MTFNIIDLLAVVLVVVATIMGARSGFVVQVMALVGFAIGVAVLLALGPHLSDFVADIEPPLRALLVLGIMAGIVLLAQSIGSHIGFGVRMRMGRGVLGGLDSGAGAVFGVVRGIFLVWLAGGLLAVAPLPTLATEARQSVVLRVLDTRLPSPVILAAEFGRLIEAAGLPDVFVEPSTPAEPVDGPEQREAEQIAAAARASTVRVEAVACANFMTGSGFAVQPAHFVTNAHVIAGADRVWVSFDGQLERHEGVIVHFDPDLDAAVVHVPGLRAQPLELADAAPARGAQAAAIGFTGGGRQRAIPAAVSRSLEALGRDIYGEGLVPREVVEMQADVAPGDSGGPLVLADGTVGGVTFSESRTDTAVGYALSPTAVADSIARSVTSTEAVSPGRCVGQVRP